MAHYNEVEVVMRDVQELFGRSRGHSIHDFVWLVFLQVLCLILHLEEQSLPRRGTNFVYPAVGNLPEIWSLCEGNNIVNCQLVTLQPVMVN